MVTLGNNQKGTPNGQPTEPRGHVLNDTMATSILLQIKDAIPRIETELKCLTDLAAATNAANQGGTGSEPLEGIVPTR